MMLLRKLEKLAHKCFDGEVTVTKVNLWLMGAVCLLAGMVYGLCMAPLTHGVTIGCNNGSNNRVCTPAKEEKKVIGECRKTGKEEKEK